jgi:hypothetical protein
MNSELVMPPSPDQHQAPVDEPLCVDPYACDEESLAALLTVPYWLPMPADPEEAEAVRSRYRAKAQAIIDGWASNTPLLRIRGGDRFHLRFLRFGEDQRFISTISHHLIHRNHPEVCPRRTDPALGGNPDAECPLCDAMRSLRGNYHPRLVTSYWVYAVVLAGTFPERSPGGQVGWGAPNHGPRRFVQRDADKIGRPHRISLNANAVIQLKALAKHDPLLFSWERGCDFELSTSFLRRQYLRQLRRGPIQLTRDLRGQERQRLSIESYLGEPHLYVAPDRVQDPHERPYRLLQADARLSALARLKEESSPDDPSIESSRGRGLQARVVGMARKYSQEYMDLHQPGWDEGSSTNPKPARGRAPHLEHRLQTLLQYRDAMRRSSKAFWAQFDAR